MFSYRRAERRSAFEARSRSVDVFARREESKYAPADYETEILSESLLEVRLGIPGMQLRKDFGSERGEIGSKVRDWDANYVYTPKSVSQIGSAPRGRQLAPFPVKDVTTTSSIGYVGGHVKHDSENHGQRPKNSGDKQSTLKNGSGYAQNQLNPQRASEGRVKEKKLLTVEVRPPGPTAAKSRSGYKQRKKSYSALQNPRISALQQPETPMNGGLFSQPQRPVPTKYGNRSARPIQTFTPPLNLRCQWIPTETCLKTKYFTLAFLPEANGPGTNAFWFPPDHGEIECYGLIDLASFLSLIVRAHAIEKDLAVIALEVTVGVRAFHVNLNTAVAEVNWTMIMGHIQLGCCPVAKVTATVQKTGVIHPVL